MYYILVIIVASFFSYPLLMENEDNFCASLEKKAWKKIEEQNEELKYISPILTNMGIYNSGIIAEKYVSKKFPDLPPFLGCNLYYWVLVINEDELQKTFVNLSDTEFQDLIMDSLISSPEMMNQLLNF